MNDDAEPAEGQDVLEVPDSAESRAMCKQHHMFNAWRLQVERARGQLAKTI